MNGINAVMHSVMSIIYMLPAFTGLSCGTTYTIKTIHDKVRVMALKKATSKHADMEQMAELLTGGKADF